MNPPIDRSIQFKAGGKGAQTIDPSKYVPSILADENNNYFVKVGSATDFELIPLNATILPSNNEPLKNGELYYYLLRGEDTKGTGHLIIALGRHWDLATLKDPSHTSEAFLNFFSANGDITSCAEAMKNLPAG